MCYSVWEPSLDLSFDEKEAETFVKEAQELTDHITEIEKSFCSKPLETIPLPKPLEDYTWVSFASTAIYLHKYLSENGMVRKPSYRKRNYIIYIFQSHFTFIDMNNTMNKTDEKNTETKIIETNPDFEKLPAEDNSLPKISHNTENEDKTISESIHERRVSQNSEPNTDLRDSTPMQTDNEEVIWPFSPL